MNYNKSKRKLFFPFIISDQIHLVCTPKPSGRTELFQTAFELGAKHFPKLLGWACALSGPDLFEETELFWRSLP